MDFDIDGVTYRTGKLTPRQQLHVLRRLAPVLAGSAALAQSQPAVEEGQQVLLSPLDMVTAFTPFADAISKLPDETVDYMLDQCLRACQRNTNMSGDAHWANVMTGTQLMFQDISMATMLRLCFETIRENMQGFFPAAPGR